MNIELINLTDVLALYDITEQISDYKFFINGYNNETSEMKVIVKVQFQNRDPLVLKFVRENHHPHHIIEKQSEFSEYLRHNGILTPKRYRSGNRYCITYTLNDIYLDVTVEDYLGEAIKTINYKHAYQIGQLMARIHNISEKGNCNIGAETIFNVVGYNEVSGYDRFVELGERGKIDSEMYRKIKEIYSEKIERIKLLWHKFPRFATQGDFSINNLSYVGEELGIFDYNIAGDVTLVGDLVLEGLLTANEMDLDTGLSDTNREELFKHFYNGYTEERPLTKDEQDVFNDIYSISSGLWFTKIVYNENSLSKLVECNNTDKVKLLLQEIYNTLAARG